MLFDYFQNLGFNYAKREFDLYKEQTNMKMITQAIYSHRYKGWSIPETCWYILMRASSRLNVRASFFYRRYKK